MLTEIIRIQCAITLMIEELCRAVIFCISLLTGKMGSFSDGFSKISQNSGATKGNGFQPRPFQQAPTWNPKEDPTSAIQEKFHQAGQYFADGILDLIVHHSGQVQKRYS